MIRKYVVLLSTAICSSITEDGVSSLPRSSPYTVEIVSDDDEPDESTFRIVPKYEGSFKSVEGSFRRVDQGTFKSVEGSFRRVPIERNPRVMNNAVATFMSDTPLPPHHNA